jgi:hypothetical protein
LVKALHLIDRDDRRSDFGRDSTCAVCPLIVTLSTDCTLHAVNHTLDPSTPALPDLCFQAETGRKKKDMFERYTEKARRVIPYQEK